jgi:hypothetical protein
LPPKRVIQLQIALTLIYIYGRRVNIHTGDQRVFCVPKAGSTDGQPMEL